MLYIMRHGKTEWNARHKLQGRTDVPLNAEERKMSEDAFHACKNIHFDICYCSPLIRARETAEIVLKGRNIPILTDNRLLEMSFGIYEGMENSFQIPDCPINVLFQKPAEYKTPVEGAESFADLYAKTGEFLKEVIMPKLEWGEDILIVGHGTMNSSIICQLKNIPIEKFWSFGIENCKLIRVV